MSIQIENQPGQNSAWIYILSVVLETNKKTSKETHNKMSDKEVSADVKDLMRRLYTECNGIHKASHINDKGDKLNCLLDYYFKMEQR